MSNADQLLRSFKAAQTRIAKIGAPERHFTPTSFGGLTGVTVKTTIGHQASPSAQNYWEDADFDSALAIVIKRSFSELAESALAVMKLQADQALVAEEASLRARLASIEAIKAEGGAA